MNIIPNPLLHLLAATAPPQLDGTTEVSPYDISTWGFGQWTAAVGILATIVGLYYTFRKNRNEEITGRTNVKVTLDKMIDERVEKQLTSAWAEIDTLKTEVKELKDNAKKDAQEKSRIKEVVKRLISSLLHWDQMGRPGDMPLPSDEDLALLEIEPFPDTDRKQMIDQVREQMDRDGTDESEEVERY